MLIVWGFKDTQHSLLYDFDGLVCEFCVYRAMVFNVTVWYGGTITFAAHDEYLLRLEL